MKLFYIAVNPVNSGFAKALQGKLKELVPELRVYRVDHTHGRLQESRGRPVFHVAEHTPDKVQQLTLFKANNVSCPNFTTDRNALDSLGADRIFARTLTNSSGGRGIVEFNLSSGGDIPNAPLYTAYIPKRSEYRVHIVASRIIDVQQKKRRAGYTGDRGTHIRNLENGYVYTRNNITVTPDLTNLALAACRALGYIYGAVDIIYNESQNKCFVLEVNSRPGLMGSTLDAYANALCDCFDLKD
jgi:hypothetical protein